MRTPDSHATQALPDRIKADLLESDRRCQLLSFLAAAGGEESVSDLAIWICAEKTGQPADQLDSEAIEAIRSDLYNHHLPKLTATGVVEYDSSLDKIRLTDSALPDEAASALAE